MFSIFRKQPVSERALKLHQQAMWKITDIVKAALAIDNDRFGNQEFLAYVRLQYILGHGGEEYETLNRSIELLRVGIKAKDSYLKIEQTEITFRGKQQQEFYQYVESLLANDISQESFQSQCQAKINSLLPTLKSDEGKQALTTYMELVSLFFRHRFETVMLGMVTL
ncbi:MAG: hypothetical protein HC934_07440 [Acaryochloridaceae cyanobacterium SU_2_1]|nr:hypothetical protein [Acaryochloridaceae cyanobacterium SU_2_1]NJM95243.1 hypothetical protein [Acaryochloridaceae cyanobacterium CSU_5_19]